MKTWLFAGLASVALAAAGVAPAQDFPTKPIRIIVGYTVGGGNDIIVRVLQAKLAEGLGQPVIVENRPGAQSIIAAEYVAKQPADGYTLLMGPSGPMTMNPATYSKLPYSPLKDFAPISMICQFPLILAVSAKLPVSSVKELVEYARQRPTQVNYASSAAPFQMAAELFKQKTGTQFVHIPYKGSGESIKAVVAGEVTMTIEGETSTLRAGDVAVVNRGVEHELYSETGMTFIEALAPVPLDHVPNRERDLVLGELGGSLHVEQ